MVELCTEVPHGRVRSSYNYGNSPIVCLSVQVSFCCRLFPTRDGTSTHPLFKGYSAGYVQVFLSSERAEMLFGRKVLCDKELRWIPFSPAVTLL